MVTDPTFLCLITLAALLCLVAGEFFNRLDF